MREQVRTLTVLYGIVLIMFNKQIRAGNQTGICRAIDWAEISIEERRKVKKHFCNQAKFAKLSTAVCENIYKAFSSCEVYWWKTGLVKVRRNFLKYLIKKTKDEENEI